MICFCQYHAVVSCFIKIRIFGRPFLKRFALCYRVPSVSLSVCDVGVLWPNGWMDQDETWHADRPQRWQHGDTTPPKRGTTHPHFSAHVYCGQTAGWIKMPRGVEVGLGPGHIVLDGDPAPAKKWHSTHLTFWPMSTVARRLDGSRGPHSTEVDLGPGHIVLVGDPATPTRRMGHRYPSLSGPCLLWPNGRPSQLQLSTCLTFLMPA